MLILATMMLAAVQDAPPPDSAQQGLGDTSYGYDAPMVAPKARPTFDDEFNGKTIDTAKWHYDTAFNKQGWFNHEKQYYSDRRPKNVRIVDGKLVIEAHKETLDPAKFPDWGGQGYTSGKLVSVKPYGYGFYEVRAKLPCGRGMWPAIWMLPEGGTWPDEGEIDIMEMVGWDPKVIHATLHTAKFNHRLNTQRGAQVTVDSACSDFHTYQLSWTPEEIVIGVDGKAYMRVKNDQPGGKAAWPFTRPYKMILNLAVGGDWGGKKGIDDTVLPQNMQVDYVRYWAQGK